MHRFRAARILTFTLALSFGGTCWIENSACAEVLQADDEHQWFKGNLHTHSHWSDGDDYLEMIADWYRKRGYHFLVFTDHNVLANTERWINVKESEGGLEAFEKLKAKFPDTVKQRKTDKGELEVRLRTFHEVAQQFNANGDFLLIQGEEISDSFEELPIHLNAGNLAEEIAPMGGRSVYETIQNNVRAVLAQREKLEQPMMVHVNHPNFNYAITAEDLMRVRGERFFEVYNGHPRVNNAGNELRASTDRMWDIILTSRLAELQLPIMYGLAVDDGHHYHEVSGKKSNPERGWVQVLAAELTAKSLIQALESGQFYSSSGVSLESITTSDAGMSIEIDPVAGETYITEFVGTRRGYDASSQPVLDEDGNEVRTTRRYSDDIGATLKTAAGTRAEYRFAGDEIYVRARITSSAPQSNPGTPGDPQRAWCQPILGPASDDLE